MPKTIFDSEVLKLDTRHNLKGLSLRVGATTDKIPDGGLSVSLDKGSDVGSGVVVWGSACG